MVSFWLYFFLRRFPTSNGVFGGAAGGIMPRGPWAMTVSGLAAYGYGKALSLLSLHICFAICKLQFFSYALLGL
jgi:hypothetical protein